MVVALKYNVFTIILLLLISPELFPQQNIPDRHYRIEYLTSDEGLSQNTVDCILKDSRGFMWFGTWNGLNRFDGYSFRIYKKEDEGGGISNNFIYSLCEDNRGDIWIGTKNGLNLFNFGLDEFRHFYEDSLSGSSVSGNRINVVYCDRQGTVWAGTNGSGLDKIEFDKKKQQYCFTNFRHSPVKDSSLSHNEVTSIYEDSKGRLWVGTSNGLNIFDKKTGKFNTYYHDPANPSSLSNYEIRSIYEDHLGNIWVGTTYGLNQWIAGTSDFIQYIADADNPGSPSHYVINEISEDPEGNLYICTLGGLDILNRKNSSFTHFPHYSKAKYSLNNEFINSIYCDETGLVWIGTEKGGVNKFNIYQKQFNYYSASQEDEIRLNHNTINSIQDEDNLLWIGTAGGGINLLNKRTGEIRYFTYDAHRDESLTNNFISSFCHDENKNFWIGSWGGGFDKLVSTRGNGSFIHYNHIPGESNSLINDFVSTIYEDFEGNIWIGTEGGMDLFLPDKNKFIHVANSPELEEQISEVGCILRTSTGNLWVGTRNGLYLVPSTAINRIRNESDPEGILCFRNVPADTSSINENYVISLFEDSRSTLWIGTYGNGLNKLRWNEDHPSMPQFRHFTTEDGLSNNVIYGILEDESGFLWLSTDYGLSKFDTESEIFRNYYVTDGLQSNQFYWSAYNKGTDGVLYFGGINGINFFYPKQILDNPVEPIPVLTDLMIYNKRVGVGEWEGKKTILDKVISETDQLVLNYTENTFSFEFSALSYELPIKNTYKYRMVGVDKDWITVSSDRRFANYTKLKGGEYYFLLKAANNDGLWCKEPLTLKITINPPFWLTTWFRMGLIVFLIASIFVYLKLHTRSLQLQKRRLEKQVKERTAQIEHQKEILEKQAYTLQYNNAQLEKRQELIEGQKIKLENQNREIIDQRDRLIDLNKKVKAINQQKLKFFTNISHEFRTPLTLILGPIDKLRNKSTLDKETKSTLDLINRNAERLLHLINQLMDFRKIEKGKINLHVQQGNIREFMQQIIFAFNELSEQRNINLDFSCPILDADIWFDHEKLENVLYNLLSNAFKYTPEYGKIWVYLNLSEKEHLREGKHENHNGGKKKYLNIEVGDTGIGIENEKLPYIFKRFYQVNNEKESPSGSGIGLALTRELVKIHHGNITVESTPKKGTVFSIHIPCSKEFYAEEDISDKKVTAVDLNTQISQLKNLLELQKKSDSAAKEIEFINQPDRPLILVVEDNIELRDFLASRLNEEYNILLAADGLEAYEKVLDEDPDLIVSDIMMPVSDGLELCQRIKGNISTCHIPVILLTARESIQNQIEGLRTGADDYVPKPFHFELLATRIKNLIVSRRNLRQLFSQTLSVTSEEITTNPTDQKFLQQALDLVSDNIDNSDFGVSDFAASMCVSRSLLHKKLTALTDQSASDFINTVRLKRSKEIMMTGSYNVSEVAYSVGYSDPKYFSRLFRKHYGISPSEFLKELRIQVS